MPPKLPFNPYEVLGIERGCSEKDIQKAYRSQCLLWHPDKNLDNKEEAKKKFLIAKEAFQFLYDKAKRQEFDREHEKLKRREAHYNARMEKADSVRRKLIDELNERERQFAENPNADKYLTPAQLHRKKKEEETRIKCEFELLRQRLEKEAADEIHAQQERLARLAREEAEASKPRKSEEKHPTLRVKWTPIEGKEDYDEDSLRHLFETYGSISTITPIRTTKKGDRICMIEFDSKHNEWGAELEKGKMGLELTGSWVIPPATPTEEEKQDTSASAPRTDFSTMSYEELQSQLFGDMPPPQEKRKKWNEDVD